MESFQHTVETSDLIQDTVNVYTCAFCLYFRRNKSELLQVAVQSLPPVVSHNEIVRFFAHKRKFPTGVCCITRKHTSVL